MGMAILKKMRKQVAVYWPLKGDESGQTDYDAFGRPQWGTPYEIACRWEASTELITLPDNAQYTTKALVYVDRVLRVGGVLYKGRLTDAGLDQDTPKNNDGAWEIVRFDETPTLKADQSLYEAYL